MQDTHTRLPSTARAEALRLALVVQLHAERIGRRIQGRRLELKAEEPKWTQPYVAEKVNEITSGKATGAEVSRWETGRHRPEDETLDALAAVLGVDVAYFHTDAPKRTGETPDVLASLNGGEPSQLDRIEEKLDRLLRRTAPSEPATRETERAEDGAIQTDLRDEPDSQQAPPSEDEDDSAAAG